MVGHQPTRIAVVGSGVSALSATRALAARARCPESALSGALITLCTSRSKLATQMGPKNQTPPKNRSPYFDYACQYITSDDPWFSDELTRWSALGVCKRLPAGSVGTLSRASGFVPFSSGQCWVGAGGMGPMMTRLIEDCAATSEHIHHESGFPNDKRKVVGLSKGADGWMLAQKGGGQLGPYDCVIGGFAQHCLTDPFLKSGGRATAAMLQCLRRVESNQIIAMQVAIEGGPLPTTFTAAHCTADDVLSFVCNNSRKPHQDGSMSAEAGGENEHWTLLSTAAFAERQFNTNNKGYRKAAEAEMLAALGRLLHTDVMQYRPRVNRINHWEDALPVVRPPASQGCLFDASVGLGWCGDFCVSPNVQGAALSGRAVASVVEDFIGGKKITNDLLPTDDAWVPIPTAQAGTVDIGAFAHAGGLQSKSTHTDLVPSAIGGYQKAAHTGRAPRTRSGASSRNSQARQRHK